MGIRMLFFGISCFTEERCDGVVRGLRFLGIYLGPDRTHFLISALK